HPRVAIESAREPRRSSTRRQRAAQGGEIAMITRKITSIAALVGLTGLLVGLLLDPKTALASYLVAWTALSAIPVGALAVLLTTYLVRAGWTHDLHAFLSGAALTVPVVAALFIPIMLGMAHLYPWVSDTVHLPPFKAAYLTPWFFVLRA